MNKAKELKEAFEWGKKNDCYNLDFPDIDWLIEQAEKVEEQQKEINWLYGKLNQIGWIIEKSREEGKKLNY